MNISIIAFTAGGVETGLLAAELLQEDKHQCSVFCLKKEYRDERVTAVTGRLSQWTEEAFAVSDGLVFIGAVGIAVRAIAPFLKSKTEDPAVIVIDEGRNHVISLLSGHIGGANRLTRLLAEGLGANPVVTTATDVNGLFAVDQWAAEIGLHISSMELAKSVAAALLDKKPVGFYSDFPINREGRIPDGLTVIDFSKGVCFPERCLGQSTVSDTEKEGTAVAARAPDLGIAVSYRQDGRPFSDTLLLVPRVLVVGVGCRKGAKMEVIEELILRVLTDNGLHHKAVKKLVSIDLKKNEEGLLALAEKWEVPFETFAAETLMEAEGEFTPSRFVKSVTGVENVCERAAVTGSRGGKLLVGKQAENGATAAVALEEILLHF